MAAPNDVSDQWRSAAVVMVGRLPVNTRPAITSAEIATIFITMSVLCVRPPAFTPRQLMSVKMARAAVATTQSRTVQTGQVQKVAGEGDGYGRHTTGIDDQQQHPAVEKCDRWMIGFAEVSILTADGGERGRQFSPNESAAHSDNAAKNPGGEDQCWSMDLLRDNVGIYEDSGTDDAAHDEHGGVKKAKLACQACLGSGGVNCAR